jgi:hypothetical protein
MFEQWWKEVRPFWPEYVTLNDDRAQACKKAYQAGQKSREPLIWQLIQHIDDRAGSDETEHEFIKRIKKELES